MRLSRVESSFGSWASSPCSPPPFPSLPCFAPHLSCPLFFEVTLPLSPHHTLPSQCVQSLHSYFRWLLWVLKNCLGRRVARWEVGVGTSGAEAREAEGLTLLHMRVAWPLLWDRLFSLELVMVALSWGLEWHIALLITPYWFPAEENSPEA